MEKYLINIKSMKNHQNQIFCVNDYGVEGEISLFKWYDIVEESQGVYTIINEWGEKETYSKTRFKLEKPNKPL
jgi:hypothetical protein